MLLRPTRFLIANLITRSFHIVAMATFRFLDLPKELRLMVYERLPIQRTNHHIRCLIIVTHSVDVQILATCRQINSEAKAFLEAKMRDIQSRFPRMLLSTRAFPRHLLRRTISMLKRSTILSVKAPLSDSEIKAIQHEQEVAMSWNTAAENLGEQRFIKQETHVYIPILGQMRARLQQTHSGTISVVISTMYTSVDVDGVNYSAPGTAKSTHDFFYDQNKIQDCSIGIIPRIPGRARELLEFNASTQPFLLPVQELG
jgi:hypothetical protein